MAKSVDPYQKYCFRLCTINLVDEGAAVNRDPKEDNVHNKRKVNFLGYSWCMEITKARMGEVYKVWCWFLRGVQQPKLQLTWTMALVFQTSENQNMQDLFIQYKICGVLYVVFMYIVPCCCLKVIFVLLTLSVTT